MANEQKPDLKSQKGANTQIPETETDEDAIIDLFDEVIDDKSTGASDPTPSLTEDDILDLTDIAPDTKETERIMGVKEPPKADTDDEDDIIELEDFYEPAQQDSNVIELGDLDLETADIETELFPSEIIGDPTDAEPVLDLDLDLTVESTDNDGLDPEFLELTEKVDTPSLEIDAAAAPDAQTPVDLAVDAQQPESEDVSGNDDDTILELTDFATLAENEEPRKDHEVDLGPDIGADIGAEIGSDIGEDAGEDVVLDDEEPLDLDQPVSFPELQQELKSGAPGADEPAEVIETSVDDAAEAIDDSIIDLTFPVEETEPTPAEEIELLSEDTELTAADFAKTAPAAEADAEQTGDLVSAPVQDSDPDSGPDTVPDSDPTRPSSDLGLPSFESLESLKSNEETYPELVDETGEQPHEESADPSELELSAASLSGPSAVGDVLDDLLQESEELDRNLDREFKRELDLDKDTENNILSRLGMELDTGVESSNPDLDTADLDEDITGTLIKAVAPGEPGAAETVPEEIAATPAAGSGPVGPTGELATEQVEAAVQQAVDKLFTEKIEAKIEKMILAAIDQAVGKEIKKLKTILLEEEPEDLD